MKRRKRSGGGRHGFLFLPAVAVLLGIFAAETMGTSIPAGLRAPPAPATKPVAQGSFVPVIVNIHKDAKISVEDAKKIVAGASKIFNDAKLPIKLVVTDTSNNKATDDSVGGADGKVGNWEKPTSSDEYKKVVSAGEAEIAKRVTKPNGKKNQHGVKVSFVVDAQDPTTAVGWNVPGSPVVVMERQNKSDGNIDFDEMANTLAHELGHAYGKLPDLYDPTDKNNLMYGYTGAGTKLTKAQKKAILSSGLLKYKTVVQKLPFAPAEKLQQQHGATADAAGDGTGAGYVDLLFASLGSLADGTVLQGEMHTAGLFGPGGEAVYSVAFDIDNDTGTGEAYKGFTGLEYALEFALRDDGGPFPVEEARWLRLADGCTETIGEGFGFHTAPLYSDGPSGAEAFDVFTGLTFELDKSLVGLSGSSIAEVPVWWIAEDQGSVYDDAYMVFDQDIWLHDATLSTFGTGMPFPGRPYPIAASGLTPSSAFDLYLDEQLWYSGMLDDTGSFFTDELLFPADVSVYVPHYLTLLDETGDFAYVVTCPVPEPITALAVLGAAVAVCRYVRRRRA